LFPDGAAVLDGALPLFVLGVVDCRADPVVTPGAVFAGGFFDIIFGGFCAAIEGCGLEAVLFVELFSP
jgi:hypothetical protein